MRSVVLILLAACVDRHVSVVTPEEPGAEIKVIPIEADLDLLFVIDNSQSTGDKQVTFQKNFGNFIAALDRFPTGRPNLHVAVVDTTVDLGISGINGCPSPDPGDNGLFQVGSGCGVNGRFLADGNYSGDLATTFTCMASVGDTGCGFEAPLEAMKRALDGSRPENAGFRRDHVPLAVVILSDEDDASLRDTSVLAGAKDDFRVQPLYAYACDQPISASAPGTYTNCRPRTDSFLRPVGDYVDFLAAQNALVAVIASPPPNFTTTDHQRANVNTDAIATGPLTFANGATQTLALQPSTTCTINNEPAIGRPALRLADFAGNFGASRGRFYNVCQPDYSAALTDLSLELDVLINPCLEGALATPLDCSVTEGTQVLPQCGEGVPDPCWTATVDAQSCPTTESHVRLDIERSSAPPDGVQTVVECAVRA